PIVFPATSPTTHGRLDVRHRIELEPAHLDPGMDLLAGPRAHNRNATHNALPHLRFLLQHEIVAASPQSVPATVAPDRSFPSSRRRRAFAGRREMAGFLAFG